MLTGRELQVVDALIRRCMTAKRAARELGISSRTVESHRYAIMDKLGVANSLELAKLIYTGARG